MTSLTLHRPSVRNAMVVREGISWANYVNAVALIFRPVVVTLGIAAAAVMWPAPAHADVAGDSDTNALNDIGIGNNGPMSTTLAGIGQSICPMLVKPGASLASMGAQMSGQGGLAPSIAGFVATLAIQTQCPGWMTSLANGQMPAGLDTLTNMAGPALGLPGAGSSSALPFALPGTAPAAPAMPFGLAAAAPATSPSPFALPGASPAPSTGLQVPGLQLPGL